MPHATPVVAPVHTLVRGRTRFRVGGLYRAPTLKGYLEATLIGQPGITAVEANTLTGHLLVRYDAGQTCAEITFLVRKMVEGFPEVLPAGAPEEESPPPVPVPAPARRNGTKQKRNGSRRELPRPGLRQLLGGAAAQAAHPWHQLKRSESLARLAASAEGLSGEEARTRLQHYGPNRLPEAEPRSAWSILREQIATVPVGLLTAAAGISVVTGGLADAVAIMAVVGINAVIGYATESQSEKTIHSLKTLVSPRALVRRDGQVLDVESRELVPGDLLLLRPGSSVAADARLLSAHQLSIEESALTGESLPRAKTAKVLAGADLQVGDRANMCYMGTLVTGGQGTAVVVATGRFTEMGRIQLLVGETAAPETPMARELDRVGTQLVIVSGALCGAVFFLGVLRGYGLTAMLKIAISLAVAAVPEGLPTVATTTLALGIRKMRGHGVLIRHLSAVETLGAAQVICLDKTGTITYNRMTVTTLRTSSRTLAADEVRGLLAAGPRRPDFDAELPALLLVGALSTESTVTRTRNGYTVHGSPTENALVHLAIEAGLDVARLKKELPLRRVVHRSAGRNYMITVHRQENGRLLAAVKGSPSEVMALCGSLLVEGENRPFGEEEKQAASMENERLASRGLRMLGIACAWLGGEEEPPAEALPALDWTWLGLVGMTDPIRPGVKELIGRFHQAGIKTVMITGDQSPTAYAVGKELELDGNGGLQILDSYGIGELDPEALAALCARTDVFARVSPAHKLRIVQALQRSGRVVAMTGDGVNDSPALKAADIGLAMGHAGTDVAREVADVVLENDELETMIIAVRHGRATYVNVRKALRFLLSTNLSEIMVTFVANAAGLGQPLTQMQLLWINLVSDIFPGLALSLEEPEQEIMMQPPRDPAEPIIRRSDFRKVTREAAVISTAALGCYGYGLTRYGVGARASSLAFQSLTGGQLLHALSCRSERHTIFERGALPPNRYLTMALGGSFALQAVASVMPGLRSLLGLGPMGLIDLAVIGATAVMPLVVNETLKGRS